MPTQELSLSYLKGFHDEFEYCCEAKTDLSLVLEDILKKTKLTDAVNELLREYTDESFDYLGALERAKALFTEGNINTFMGVHIFIAHLFATLRERYRIHGIDDGIFVNTAKDLRYKTDECKFLEGVYGVYSSTWYSGFFKMKIFGFGRLQYQMRTFDTEFTLDGVELKPDTLALFVHIPRSLEPLTPEAAHASYAMAKEFFKDSYFKGAPCVICCSSWLLFPAHEYILKPESNIRRFMSDFTRVSVKESYDYTHLWRIFEKRYKGNPDELPADSTLRRGYIQLLKEGKPAGSALGVFIL